jgi:hypothetical protein
MFGFIDIRIVEGSADTGGSATELSATDAWHRAAADDENDRALILSK